MKNKNNKPYTITNYILGALCVIALIVGFIIGNSAINNNIYPDTAIVYNVDCYTDTVTVIDCNGSLWQFKGSSDWEVGDVVSMIKNNNGTEEIKDDTIIKERYSGSADMLK